jgi:DnaK suppressor protein
VTKGEGLSAAQREQLRRALETKKAQLLLACEEREEEVTGGEVDAGDEADVAEGVIEDRQRAALDEHDRALLGEIEHALARIDAGNYGVSEKSGRPIRFERLLAVPWARYDTDEAERAEHG